MWMLLDSNTKSNIVSDKVNPPTATALPGLKSHWHVPCCSNRFGPHALRGQVNTLSSSSCSSGEGGAVPELFFCGVLGRAVLLGGQFHQGVLVPRGGKPHLHLLLNVCCLNKVQMLSKTIYLHSAKRAFRSVWTQICDFATVVTRTEQEPKRQAGGCVFPQTAYSTMGVIYVSCTTSICTFFFTLWFKMYLCFLDELTPAWRDSKCGLKVSVGVSFQTKKVKWCLFFFFLLKILEWVCLLLLIATWIYLAFRLVRWQNKPFENVTLEIVLHIAVWTIQTSVTDKKINKKRNTSFLDAVNFKTNV